MGLRLQRDSVMERHSGLPMRKGFVKDLHLDLLMVKRWEKLKRLD